MHRSCALSGLGHGGRAVCGRAPFPGGSARRVASPRSGGDWSHCARVGRSRRAHAEPGAKTAVHRGRRSATVARLPFDPPKFRPEKLEARFLPCTAWYGSQPLRDPLQTVPRRAPYSGRCYTLTHNDLTGHLLLSVGSQFNGRQISGWYTRLLRDEVLGEWRIGARGQPTLHLLCHISGEARWIAPARLRDYIFRREMSLVLDAIRYADRMLLALFPELQTAEVFVHFISEQHDLDCVEQWGRLDDPSTWPSVVPSFSSLPSSSFVTTGEDAAVRRMKRTIQIVQLPARRVYAAS